MPEVSGSHSSSVSLTALYSVFRIRLCLKDTIPSSLLRSHQQVRIRDLSPAHPFLFGLVIITNYIYLAGIQNNINHTQNHIPNDVGVYILYVMFKLGYAYLSPLNLMAKTMMKIFKTLSSRFLKLTVCYHYPWSQYRAMTHQNLLLLPDEGTSEPSFSITLFQLLPQLLKRPPFYSQLPWTNTHKFYAKVN